MPQRPALLRRLPWAEFLGVGPAGKGLRRGSGSTGRQLAEPGHRVDLAKERRWLNGTRRDSFCPFRSIWLWSKKKRKIPNMVVCPFSSIWLGSKNEEFSPTRCGFGAWKGRTPVESILRCNVDPHPYGHGSKSPFPPVNIQFNQTTKKGPKWVAGLRLRPGRTRSGRPREMFLKWTVTPAQWVHLPPSFWMGSKPTWRKPPTWRGAQL